MAEKDIKKTPAATQTVQPSADKYTIQELENASAKVFGVPHECAVAAFKGCKKTGSRLLRKRNRSSIDS